MLTDWFINSQVALWPLFLSYPLITSSFFHPLASHYSSMLEKEGLIELLKALAAHPDTHSDIKGLSNSIMRMVEQQNTSGAFSNQTESQNC